MKKQRFHLIDPSAIELNEANANREATLSAARLLYQIQLEGAYVRVEETPEGMEIRAGNLSALKKETFNMLYHAADRTAKALCNLVKASQAKIEEVHAAAPVPASLPINSDKTIFASRFPIPGVEK